MKFHSKRIRRLRRLALVGCIVAVAAPASASAMYPDRAPARNDVQPQQQPYTLPSSFRSEVQTQSPQQQAYTLPASFRSEVQTQSPQPTTTVTAFTLHKGFRPEVTAQSPANATAPASIIRQIETVNDNSGRTLAIVLAAIALAVALATLCFAAVRLTHTQSREVGSH